MGLVGYTFDRMKVSPKSDALLYSALMTEKDMILNGFKDELEVFSMGLNTYVKTGACIVQGRLIEVDEETQVSVSANDEGYICIVIDLTKNNTSTGEAGTPDYMPINNQISLEIVKDLIQQDLHDDGQIYTFPIATFKSTGTSVTVENINRKKSGLSKGEKLWSGAAYPRADFTYPSKKLSECENGWILVFQSYKGEGVVNAWDVSYHLIEKNSALMHSGQNTKIESFNTGGASKVYKQVYLTDESIKGHEVNGEGTNANQVLSEVWSW